MSATLPDTFHLDHATTVSLAELRERLRALDRLADLEPPAIELPEPEIHEMAPEPLFTTTDDFVTATRKLKARKALDDEGEGRGP